MSPRPELHPTWLPGVRRDRHGRIWIRARAQDPAGVMRGIGWRLATEQGVGPEAEAAACSERRALQQAIREGRTEEEATRRWTVREWFEHISREDVSPATRSSREIRSRAWLGAIGDLDLATVTVADVERAWAVVQGEGLSPSTQKISLTYLRQPFAAAHRHGIIDRDVAQLAQLRIPPARRSREARAHVLDGAELGPVMLALRKRDLTAAPYFGWFPHALTLWCTGMRRAELEEALVSHLDDDGRSLWIPADGEKTGRGRIVRIHPWLRAHLGEHLTRRGKVGPEDRIFTLSRDGMTYRWELALKAAGIRYGRKHGTTIQRLRHAMRTTCQSKGVRDRVIDLYLGHGDQKVTDTYSLAMIDELDEPGNVMANYARAALLEAGASEAVVDPVEYWWGTES